jgi:hypothetical protein
VTENLGDADPIAYTALQPGTPVLTTDGVELGTVEHVLRVEEVDVFDGPVVQTTEGIRFVDAGQVGSIYAGHVATRLSSADASALPEPDQDAPVYETDAGDDTGDSLADRFGRMFGRGKWTRER